MSGIPNDEERALNSRRTLLILCLVTMLAGPLAAADQKGKGKKGTKGLPGLTLPKSIVLSSNQQTKFKELQVEYVSKFADIQKKLDAILTPEVRRQVKELDKARGTLVKEADAKVLSILTDKQKAQFKSRKGDKFTKGDKGKGDKFTKDSRPPKDGTNYKEIWAKLQALVKAGKLTAEQANAKMAAIKKAAQLKGPKGDKGKVSNDG